MQGEIKTESNPDKRTTFKIILPYQEQVKEQIHFEDKFAKLYYLTQKNIGVVYWKDPTTYSQSQDIFLRVIDILRKYNTSSWILDVRQKGLSKLQNRNWLLEKIIPQTIQHGLKSIAVVIGEIEHEKIVKHYLKKLQHKLQQHSIKVDFFVDTNVAKEWLKKQK